MKFYSDSIVGKKSTREWTVISKFVKSQEYLHKSKKVNLRQLRAQGSFLQKIQIVHVIDYG